MKMKLLMKLLNILYIKLIGDNMMLQDIYRWEDIELFDDDTDYGGISYEGETLENFVDECDIADTISIRDLNNELIDNGIQPLYINEKHLDIDSKFIDDVFYEQDHDRVEIILSDDASLLVPDGAIFNVKGFYYIIGADDVMTLLHKDGDELCTWKTNGDYKLISHSIVRRIS